MMPTARRTVVWLTTHSPRGLVEQVDFATSGGARTLVTPLAVFEREREGRFELAHYRADTTVEEIRALTGFAFDAGRATPSEPPSADEEQELERLDAGGVLERIFGRPRAHVTNT